MNNFEVKSTLSIEEKLDLLDRIKNSNVVTDFVVDYLLLEITKVCLITKFYCPSYDFEINELNDKEDVFETYNKLMRDNFYREKIVSNISEYNEIISIIDKTVEQMSDYKYALIKKVLTFDVNDALEQIKDFDKSKLTEISRLFSDIKGVGESV